MKCIKILLIFFFLCILLSCTTFSYQNTGETYLQNNLTGLWGSKKGVCEYPFVLNAKKYIRFSSLERNDTDLWNAYCRENSIDINDLWKKRYSYLIYIYSDDFIYDKIPVSDEQGIESGIKVYRSDDGNIYSRIEILIPEDFLLLNSNYFTFISSKKFKTNGTFYLNSNVFKDINFGRITYKRQRRKIRNDNKK
jgi:hypothetical protein